MRSVLFVCTANICRSPMAMGLLRAKVAGGTEEWRVESAGIWAQRGLPPAFYTVEMLLKRGIDLSDYGSRAVTSEMIQDFYLILVMERNQREALRSAFPLYASKIFMLSEMIGLVENIPDPVGGDLEDYVATANRLERILSNGLPKIFQLALIPKA